MLVERVPYVSLMSVSVSPEFTVVFSHLPKTCHYEVWQG